MRFPLLLLTLFLAGSVEFLVGASKAQSAESSIADLAEQQRWKDVVASLGDQGLGDQGKVDAPQPDGMTALHWAAFWNQPKVVEQLLAAGAKEDVATEYGITPLAVACRLGHDEAANVLLGAGADAQTVLAGGETVLMHAARAGNAALVEALIERGAAVDAKQRDGQTALMWAAARGNLEAVDVLLEHGCDWQHDLRSGFTALHFAARQGHADIVRRLLDAGADIQATMNPLRTSGRAPRKGMSPLLLAVESGHFELALMMVDWGADPNDQRSGFAPLHALSWVRRPPRGDNAMGDPPPVGSGQVGSLQFARELVRRGADVNLQLEDGKYRAARLNDRGATPLLYAAYTSDLPYARLLVELGADVQLANADGTTPLLAAAGVGIFVADEFPGTEAETLAMVRQLVQWGGHLDDRDEHGETVVHGAAYRSFPRVVDLLVELGAQPEHWNRKNQLGSTPKQIAQGKRPGSFKPNPETEAAIDRALQASDGS
ncbi:ankyrin repeat domain-containing protein [Roseiconus nitratireducens]|uniref:Ankyrin repeat domain-containing protein n=1 Tax=Roseiconus nitratireducens TaxID=2605748 RepID=A0A5M6D7S1_9BACT|nr:ankyrin repeat domain-containing protein [Roseiconus nitratireducens]KAA5543604.1 ankyrin repeat domain-containing protein [Roseiconus nitratireducens]